MQDKNEVTVKLKPNISRNKCLSILRYGALPHRPTKGLSGRPLETFGRKYFVFILEMPVFRFLLYKIL